MVFIEAARIAVQGFFVCEECLSCDNGHHLVEVMLGKGLLFAIFLENKGKVDELKGLFWLSGR